jgi:hypothetical protein
VLQSGQGRRYGKSTKKHRAVLLTLAALAAAFILPLSRYAIRHVLLTGVMYDIAMLDYFYDDWMFAQTLLLNGILFLMASLLTKLFGTLIAKTESQLPTKMFSLKNPQNFAALIFCIAAVFLATVLFFSIGSYGWEDILALIVEYAVNGARFAIIAFVSFTVVKWNQRVYKKTV